MNRVCIAAIVSLMTVSSVSAAERVTATRIGNDLYKLDDGRVAVTTGCTAYVTSDDAILNDAEDTITFVDDAEECDIREFR